MKKIFYVIFFIIHIFIYYKAFHNECIQKVDEYYNPDEVSVPLGEAVPVGTDENIPDHFNKGEWETHIYELMKEEWIQDILYPITPECNGGSDTCFSPHHNINRPIMIPFDKLIKVSTVIDGDNIMEPITEFYVKDNDKNKIKLDISKDSLEKSIYIDVGISYNKNPFYFVECIAQWERYPLHKLSPKCFRVPQNEGGRQDHTHTLDIIHDLIYPRYLHYKTISYRNG